MNKTVRNEEELISILKKDIGSTNRNLKIFCGHLPLRYQDNGPGERIAFLDENRWGFFSSFTFELGSQLLRYALDHGKTGSLIVLVDDDIELPRKYKEDKLVKRDVNEYRSPRNQAFRESKLPEVYEELLKDYNLDTTFFVKQLRKGFNNIFISEKHLKKQAKNKGLVAEDPCSRAYKGLLFTGHYFDPKKDYLISFMPEQCKGNICRGVLDVGFGLESSHVFFPDIDDMGAINECEDGYVESKERKPLSLNSAFENSKISYRRDTSE